MLRALRASVADIARRSALGLGGGIALAVALGFFTSAGWYSLAAWKGPVVAGVVVGLIYLLVGLVLLLIARDPTPAPPPHVSETQPMQRVVAAFFDGIEAGSRARRVNRRGPDR